MSVLIPFEKLEIPGYFHIAGDVRMHLGVKFNIDRYIEKSRYYWEAFLEFSCYGLSRTGKVTSSSGLTSYLAWAFSEVPFIGSPSIEVNENRMAEWLAEALVGIRMNYANSMHGPGQDVSNYIFELSFPKKERLKFFFSAWELRGIITPKVILREYFQLEKAPIQVEA